MKRSMSRQAEAERERRARIITADGEYQASKRLAAAANVMSRDPAALQLRLLQTVVEVAAEKNSTLVMPVPVELLRFFDKFAPGESGPRAADAEPDLGDAEVAEAEAEISGAVKAPVEIPEVPKIPELSPAEKGDLGAAAEATPAADADPGPDPAAEPGPDPAADPGEDA
jgi:regulator of protease activity HflC (stomatin/prohibitin superfamily)